MHRINDDIFIPTHTQIGNVAKPIYLYLVHILLKLYIHFYSSDILKSISLSNINSFLDRRTCMGQE